MSVGNITCQSELARPWVPREVGIPLFAARRCGSTFVPPPRSPVQQFDGKLLHLHPRGNVVLRDAEACFELR